MSTSAIIFMTIVWACVISLVVFCYSKMLSTRKPGDEHIPPSDPVK